MKVESLEGIYKAYVLDNEDEYGRERLFVRVIGIHSTTDNFSKKQFGIWAEHCSPFYYTSGEIPPIGSYVFVQFVKDSDEYNPMSCIWIGCVRANKD